MASLYLGTGPLEQELVRLRGESRPLAAQRLVLAESGPSLVRPMAPNTGAGREDGGGRGEAQSWPLTLLVSVPSPCTESPLLQRRPQMGSSVGPASERDRGVPRTGCARSGAWPARGPFLTVSPYAWQVDCLESTLEKSLQAKGPSDLKVSILLDFMRGSRGGCGPLPASVPLRRRAGEDA